jgi:hypothetical protein
MADLRGVIRVAQLPIPGQYGCSRSRYVGGVTTLRCLPIPGCRYRMAESLLAAEVPFSCLNGCVSKQRLNLLKLSACQTSQGSEGPGIGGFTREAPDGGNHTSTFSHIDRGRCQVLLFPRNHISAHIDPKRIQACRFYSDRHSSPESFRASNPRCLTYFD